MKKLSVLVVTASLLAVSLAGCASNTESQEMSDSAIVQVVPGGDGSTPETALPMGGAYQMEDGIEILIGEPTSATLSGFTADEYDLSAGDPISVPITFVNRADSEMTTGGVFVELVSGGEVAQVVLNSEAKRVFHSGLTDAYTEEELLEMAPLALKSGKPYTFTLEFIVADPADVVLGIAGVDQDAVYFTNQ